MGYVCGGLIAGGVADALGYSGAIALVAGLTAASGLWVLRDMPTDRSRPVPASAGASRSERSPAVTRQAATDGTTRTANPELPESGEANRGGQLC
jgi:hypothetical protein